MIAWRLGAVLPSFTDGHSSHTLIYCKQRHTNNIPGTLDIMCVCSTVGWWHPNWGELIRGNDWSGIGGMVSHT